MNIFKKYLAMFLVICMLVGAVPVSVFASETDGTVPEVTETPEATELPEVTDAPEVTEAPASDETEIPDGEDVSAAAGDTENETAADAGDDEDNTDDPEHVNVTLNADGEDDPEQLAANETVDVTLWVGQTMTYTDNTGNYGSAVTDPDAHVVSMSLTGVAGDPELILKQVNTATDIASDKQYVLENKRSGKALNNTTSTNHQWNTELIQQETAGATVNSAVWTITKLENDNYYVQDQNGYYMTIGADYGNLVTTPTELTLHDYGNGTFAFAQGNQYLNDTGNSGQYAGGYWVLEDSGAPWYVYSVEERIPASTTITFEGVAPGKTTAVVGNTTYNITVTSLEQTVDIELEVGETFTYTDTTGAFTEANITQNPDGTYATLDSVTKVSNSAEKSLIPVTGADATFSSTKSYVIENVRAKTAQTDCSVLTSGEAYGGLVMDGPVDAYTSQYWTVTPSGSQYLISRNGEYVTIGNAAGSMESTPQELSLEYVAGNGWLIYNDIGGNGASDDGDCFLSDLYGAESGEAKGYLTKADSGNYWYIYEVQEDPLTWVTQVQFTGHAATTTPTTAKVGYTTYNITVVAQETDDEVENTGTDIWTVDPEIQAQRISEATAENAGYTTATWTAYQQALTAANNKLAEVTAATYTSQAAAQAALDELKTLTDALEAAKAALEPGKPITVRYWRVGEVVLEETIYVPADAVTYELEPTKTHDGVQYNLNATTLNMAGGVSEFDVQLLREGYVTEGIVGSANIGATQLEGRPVKEMTVTAGITYDLDVADILADGQSVEWSSNNTAVATVDANGVVTAVAEGTAVITATIKDADGNAVKTYKTSITVLPGVEVTNKRTVAVYIDNVDNTTVSCALYANGEATKIFNVLEGELIYGQFQSGTQESASAGGLLFFGNPDDKYALVSMTSTNSAGQYYPVHDADGNVVQSDGSPLAAVNGKYYFVNTAQGPLPGLFKALELSSTVDTESTVWTDNIVAVVKSHASDGYDGAMGFSRTWNEGGLNSNLSFASDPMPEIDKTVDGVLPSGGKFQNYQHYVPNMVAGVDEIVFFKITVTLERPSVWQKNNNGTVATDADGNPLSAVVYTDTKLVDTALENPATDEMDAYFYTKELDGEGSNWNGIIEDTTKRKNIQDITDAMNAGWADDEDVRVLEYYVVYKIQPTDIPKFNIANIVQFQYNYASSYSSGSLTASADADADITVIGEAMDNVVIDFGQTFVYTGLSNRHLKGVFVNGTNDVASITQCKAKAEYGTVTVTREHMKDENGNLLYEGQDNNRYPQYEYTVTYTPTKILQAPDMVRLYGIGEEGKEKIINGFIVYPATTVYYEEGFAFTGEHSGWNLDNSKKATVNQTLEKLGRSEKGTNDTVSIVSDKQNEYGFDPIYNSAGAPNGSYAMSIAKNSKTVFEFTGDGIQIFANCTKDTGYVAVEVRDKATNRVVRMSMVNTVVAKGDTNATIGQSGNMDALPVVSLLNIQKMPHGTYRVTISKAMDDKAVNIDGIRIFNTVEQNENDSPFTIDLEDRPDFYELRDAVLHAVGAKANTTMEDTTEDYKGRLAQQIYDEKQGAKALIFDEEVDYADSKTVQDLLDNGPKNELFLYPGQTLSFKVTTKRVMQVGLKAPQGETKASITVTANGTNTQKDVSIQSSVDMFYYLVDQPAGAETEYTVSIKNNGQKMLSVTLLKICDDPSAAFKELTKEDIEDILEEIYGKVESILGNIDDDGDVDVDDVLALLWNVLFPEDYPIDAEADFDGNDAVDVDDVLALLWYVLFPEDYPLN